PLLVATPPTPFTYTTLFRSYRKIVYHSAPTALATTLATAPLGLIAVALFDRGTLAPLLLVPPILVVSLNSRFTAAQRDEHLRVEDRKSTRLNSSHVAISYAV